MQTGDPNPGTGADQILRAPTGHNCPVPELPEVQALTAGLRARMAGHAIDRCRLVSFSALKTVRPPLDELVGRVVTDVQRRGKFVCIDADGLWLVVHLARGGWIKWFDKLPDTALRPGRSPIALRVGLADGAGFDVTEMGTEKRVALWVVRSPDEVEPVAALGVDPLGPEFTVERFGALLHGTSATLKTALTTQTLIAGVGNAYSDEALHRAGMSPYKKTTTLDAAGVARLHAALVGVLADAVGRSAGARARPSSRGTRSGPCRSTDGPARRARCAGTPSGRSRSPPSRSSTARPARPGGKPLADRRLSRLLK